MVSASSLWINSIINSPQAPTLHKTFYWESGGSKNNPQWAVREGDWKLLHNPTQSKPDELDDEGLFLVNIKEDPSEKQNLSRKNSDIMKKLKQKYQQWIDEVYTQ